MDPNRKRRAHRLLGTDRPDPELAKLSDEQLLAEYERVRSGEAQAERERAERESADPFFAYLHDLSDEELIAEYAAAQTALVAQLGAKTDAQLRAMLYAARGEPIAPLIEAEIERRRPKPEADVTLGYIAEPPVEPHAVVLQEPTAAELRQIETVARIVAEEDPRERWRLEQAAAMAEAVRLATEDGERQARRAHELGLAHPGERVGAGELLDILRRDV
jgi:hypothetical protein